MAGYLEDLDELILKCRNKKAREYIRESVASYRAEAYRSAIVSCWVAVCYDMIEKLRELALAGDKQAVNKIEELDKIHQDNDTSRSLKFEREILDFARDKLELISALEHEDLDRILKDRHRCAHPSLNAEGEQYAPPAELARLHIHSAVTHLLQHEPAQGKFALDRVLSQLNSKYFPYEKSEVMRAFENNPIRKARPSLVRGFVTVLFKDLFLKNNTDYRTVWKLTASLNAVGRMHRILYEDRCSEILSDIVSQVEDDNLHHAVKNMSMLQSAWQFLNETEKGRLSRYVESLPSHNFDMIDDILNYQPLKDAAIERVNRASIEDLKEAMIFFIIPKEIINRAIELYHQSKSFDEANKIAILITTCADYFSDDQVSILISKIKDNDQITGSFELPGLLKIFRETVKRMALNFDKLLRQYGLEEHCEDVTEERDEIPF